MSTLSPPGASTASSHVIGPAARAHWSFASLLSRAIVILIGLAVGCVIGAFIGLLNGWIEIPIC